MIGRFLAVTSILAGFLLVVTSGFDDRNAAVVEINGVNAAVANVISPLSFGTMTMYWDQRNAALDFAQSNTRVSNIQASDLDLLQIQQVSRHGSRFPTDNTMEEITNLLDKLQTNYSSVIPHWLRNYSLPYNMSVAGVLSSTGFEELAEYGKRTRISDPLLRFYDICDRYLSEVKHNPNASAELKAYGRSSQMNESIAYLKSRLNLPKSAVLTATDTRAAFAACAFDIMVYGTPTQWCSIMDQAFLNRLDYAEDLEAFYEQGAGFKINYEMAAVLLQDIYTYMKNFTTGNTTIVGNLRFGHAETTIPLMTLLGYGDRTKLLSSWTDEQVDSRGFRTSVLSPTASNIDFRLYQGKTDKKYYVSVWIQEVEAPLPGCGSLYCELSKVEKLWGYYLNDYKFKTACKKQR
ncbi:hypothetical protein BBO99_00003056 [Phytophthora kernoviae]|uniref:Multiple inositol polyphosphate phosphatase 1 n=1 Tax=Phytophthora kernoviae TaxID=325452 RepID=A0A3R7KW85_9STRA|nr:hypothetical protein JM16_000999 [Phytophthora kernoviae]KAG2530230.1 hypothetical protein JM18_001081 [Phytophthora kernoviae]RLN06407.1 hypothetical protein BBI17_003167 [Phytophthora kernoviae]RLN82244.1 hypothetical protein BBO99_00003056 [Phytophthora kernoviae]